MVESEGGKEGRPKDGEEESRLVELCESSATLEI